MAASKTVPALVVKGALIGGIAVLPLGAVLLGGMAITWAHEVPSVERLGGCQTTERVCGLPALSDTLADAALSELMAPGMGPKVGEACRAIGVDTPLFVQIGALDSLQGKTWVAISNQVTALLISSGARIAGRSLLRHTIGPCFPPNHIDFRACGDSVFVRSFLDALAQTGWEGFSPAPVRRERKLFITAGTSLQLMDAIVDLK